MGTLTRQDMEAVIKGGGSVLYKGQTLWQLSQLPTDADLAEGDPAAESAAAAALDQQIAHLTAQRDRLLQRGQSPTIEPPPSTSAPLGGTPPSGDPIVEALGQQTADALAAAGYTTPGQLQSASDEQLLSVPGIGQATLNKIRAAFGQVS